MSNVVALKAGPGRQGVSYESIVAVAERIVAEGGKPTLRGVRERLGTGSLGTIQQHLKDWQQGRAPAVPVDVSLPTGLQSALLDEIASQVQTARADLEEHVRLIEQQRDELTEENARLEALLIDQADSMKVMELAVAAANGAKVELADVVKEWEARFNTERQRADVAEKACDGFQCLEADYLARIDQLAEANAHLQKCLDDQADSMKVMELAVAAANGAKVELADAVKEWQARFESERHRADAADKQREDAQTRENVYQARLESAARELEDVKARSSQEKPQKDLLAEIAKINKRLDALIAPGTTAEIKKPAKPKKGEPPHDNGSV
ncbi:MAG: DNA-binding protein [Methylococcaceae bacterium]|nr:MAG: DNA-binding protein [Methylococcaceae bacterium]